MSCIFSLRDCTTLSNDSTSWDLVPNWVSASLAWRSTDWARTYDIKLIYWKIIKNEK